MAWKVAFPPCTHRNSDMGSEPNRTEPNREPLRMEASMGEIRSRGFFQSPSPGVGVPIQQLGGSQPVFAPALGLPLPRHRPLCAEVCFLKGLMRGGMGFGQQAFSRPQPFRRCRLDPSPKSPRVVKLHHFVSCPN